MAHENILSIDDDNFDRLVLGSDQPFLLDFSARWCGPCKMLLPVVQRIADESVGKVRVGKIDIDDSPRVAQRLGIRGAPTVVVFAGGKEVARHTGVTSKERLVAMVQSASAHGS
jgi:thioredoxin 1